MQIPLFCYIVFMVIIIIAIITINMQYIVKLHITAETSLQISHLLYAIPGYIFKMHSKNKKLLLLLQNIYWFCVTLVKNCVKRNTIHSWIATIYAERSTTSSAVHLRPHMVRQRECPSHRELNCSKFLSQQTRQ